MAFCKNCIRILFVHAVGLSEPFMTGRNFDEMYLILGVLFGSLLQYL